MDLAVEIEAGMLAKLRGVAARMASVAALGMFCALVQGAQAADAAERSTTASELGAEVSGDSGVAGEGLAAVGARIAGDEARTRFILDLTQPTLFGLSTLADPYRLIIDLPETKFELSSDAGKNGRGLISDWRYGLFASGRSRLVLDLNSPASVDKFFILPSVDKQPARLVIDLIKAEPAEFEVGVIKPAPAKTITVSKGDRQEEKKDSGLPIIVIDPGHGGIDTGAMGGEGTLEKAVVLDFAKALKHSLEQSGLYEIHLTRENDTFIPLGKRVTIARELNADLFISIHADSVVSSRDQVRGATVYTQSDKASDMAAAALAERENKSDIIAGIDLSEEPVAVSDILVDLTRRETRNFSIFFARALVNELKSAAKVIKNPHRSAGFRVLRAHDMPSVLVELGYLSNRFDEKLLTSDEWRERTSAAISAAVDIFFRTKLSQGSGLVTGGGGLEISNEKPMVRQ